MSDGARPSAPHLLRADAGTAVAVARLGSVGYLDAWDLQRRLVAERQQAGGRDTLLLLEHPAVYTLGKRADRSHVLLDDRELTRRGIEVVDVDRGGDVTYHGPGQLVGYPIVRLAGTRGVVDYVRALEEVLIRAVADLGVQGERSPGYTGVWVGDQKLAAIGVRVASRGVTSHGFALNVAPELTDFAGIVPCGIRDRGVCSLASLGVEVAMDTVCDAVERAFATVFAATLEPVGLDALAPATSLPKVSP